MNDSVTVGAVATICAAIVGAIATIAAALISRRRAANNRQEQEPENTSPIEQRPLGDGVLRVRENTAIIISDIELTIAVHLVILDDQINFEYRIPQMEKPFIGKNIRVGFQNLIEREDKAYTLTLIRIDGINKDAFFDLRKVNKISKPPIEQPAATPELPRKEVAQEEVEITGTCPFCGAQYMSIGKPKNCSYCGMKFS